MAHVLNEAETWEIDEKKKCIEKKRIGVEISFVASLPFKSNLMTDKPSLTINFMTTRVFLQNTGS